MLRERQLKKISLSLMISPSYTILRGGGVGTSEM